MGLSNQSAHCLPCAAGTFQNMPGQAGCAVCASSAWAAPGALSCTCLGRNRVYHAADGACVCRGGHDYRDASFQRLSDQDGTQDCQPIVYDNCFGGAVRAVDGSCQPLAASAQLCDRQCGGGAGVFNVRVGLCECAAATPLELQCNASCRAAVPMLSVGPPPSWQLLADGVPLGSLGAIRGTLACGVASSASEPCPVVPVTMSAGGGFAGVYGLPPQMAALLVGAPTIEGGTTRRLASSQLSAATSAVGIPRPVVCIRAGGSLLFVLPNGSFPVFVKDSLLNSNPAFDFSAFRALASSVRSGVHAPLFAFALTHAGVYEFASSIDGGERMVVAAMGPGATCPTEASIVPMDAATLLRLGSRRGERLATSLNWRLVASAVGALAAAAVLGVGSILLLQWQPWGATPHATAAASRRAAAGVIKPGDLVRMLSESAPARLGYTLVLGGEAAAGGVATAFAAAGLPPPGACSSTVRLLSGEERSQLAFMAAEARSLKTQLGTPLRLLDDHPAAAAPSLRLTGLVAELNARALHDRHCAALEAEALSAVGALDSCALAVLSSAAAGPTSTSLDGHLSTCVARLEALSGAAATEQWRRQSDRIALSAFAGFDPALMSMVEQCLGRDDSVARCQRRLLEHIATLAPVLLQSLRTAQRTDAAEVPLPQSSAAQQAQRGAVLTLRYRLRLFVRAVMDGGPCVMDELELLRQGVASVRLQLLHAVRSAMRADGEPVEGDSPAVTSAAAITTDRVLRLVEDLENLLMSPAALPAGPSAWQSDEVEVVAAASEDHDGSSSAASAVHDQPERAVSAIDSWGPPASAEDSALLPHEEQKARVLDQVAQMVAAAGAGSLASADDDSATRMSGMASLVAVHVEADDATLSALLDVERLRLQAAFCTTGTDTSAFGAAAAMPPPQSLAPASLDESIMRLLSDASGAVSGGATSGPLPPDVAATLADAGALQEAEALLAAASATLTEQQQQQDRLVVAEATLRADARGGGSPADLAAQVVRLHAEYDANQQRIRRAALCARESQVASIQAKLAERQARRERERAVAAQAHADALAVTQALDATAAAPVNALAAAALAALSPATAPPADAEDTIASSARSQALATRQAAERAALGQELATERAAAAAHDAVLLDRLAAAAASAAPEAELAIIKAAHAEDVARLQRADGAAKSRAQASRETQLAARHAQRQRELLRRQQAEAAEAAALTASERRDAAAAAQHAAELAALTAAVAVSGGDSAGGGGSGGGGLGARALRPTTAEAAAAVESVLAARHAREAGAMLRRQHAERLDGAQRVLACVFEDKQRERVELLRVHLVQPAAPAGGVTPDDDSATLAALDARFDAAAASGLEAHSQASEARHTAESVALRQRQAAELAAAYRQVAPRSIDGLAAAENALAAAERLAAEQAALAEERAARLAAAAAQRDAAAARARAEAAAELAAVESAHAAAMAAERQRADELLARRKARLAEELAAAQARASADAAAANDATARDRILSEFEEDRARLVGQMDAVRTAQAAHTAKRLEERRQRQLAAASRAAQAALSASAPRASSRLLSAAAAPGGRHATLALQQPSPAAGSSPPPAPPVDGIARGSGLDLAAQRLHILHDGLSAYLLRASTVEPDRASGAAAALAPGGVQAVASNQAGLEQRLEMYRAALKG